MTLARSFRAIVWLRWRLLVNSFKGGRRRDAMEQVSRAFATMMPFAFFALSLGTVVAVAVLGFIGGRAVATGLIEPDVIVLIVRISLAVVIGLLLIVSIASPVQTTLAKYSRLLILPIPRQTLHVTEVAANLVDPWIGFVIPGMFTFALGLAMGGNRRAAVVTVAAGIGILIVLASTGALISFLIGWLLRSRRRGEMFTLVFVLGLSLLSFIPAMLSKQLDERRLGRGTGRRQPAMTVEQFDRSLPAWSRAVPSELYGRAVRAGVEQRLPDAAGALAWLWIEGAVLFTLSSAAHRRLIGALEGDARRRRKNPVRTRQWRLPLAGAAVSAIAITGYRSALRSVRGRLAVLLPGPLVALLATLFRGMPDEHAWLAAMLGQGHFVFAAGLVFAIYAAQPFSMNLFGADRGGLTRLFLVPASDVELARGKVAGCGLVLATSGALALLISAIVSPNGPVLFWIATLLAGIATFAWLTPIMVWLSALFPVPADMSKTGTGGNPHPVPMLAGTLLVLALALPAAGVFLVNWVWIRHEGAVVAMMAVWAVLSVIVAVPLVGVASRTIATRRENLAMVAQGR